jgi:hypothetical protein
LYVCSEKRPRIASSDATITRFALLARGWAFPGSLPTTLLEVLSGASSPDRPRIQAPTRLIAFRAI